MKRVLLVAVSLLGLSQGCQADNDSGQGQQSPASEGSKGFCDPDSADFYKRQSTIAWEPVQPERIAEADYRGRTFEARMHDEQQELFAYKVLMNIGGKPIHVSVALLDRRQATVDMQRLASEAKMLLQNEAVQVARKQGAMQAFVSLSSNDYDIVLWPWRSGWYFSVVAPEGFSVFEIVGNTVGYVCTV